MGPSLGDFGVDVCSGRSDLGIARRDGAIIATNDNWADTQRDEVMASGIPPPNELESAIVRTLAPGAYTALVDGKKGGTGTALVEVYDLSPTSDSTLGNISTRGAVGPQSDVMIGGFIISGTTGTTRVLVRTVAPSLISAGVTNAMPDPILELRDGNGTLIAANDNWRDGPESEIEESNLAPTNDLESAIITTLPSGPYTAVIHEKNGQSRHRPVRSLQPAESVTQAVDHRPGRYQDSGSARVSPLRTLLKDCFGGTPKPTRETGALPGSGKFFRQYPSGPGSGLPARQRESWMLGAIE